MPRPARHSRTRTAIAAPDPSMPCPSRYCPAQPIIPAPHPVIPAPIPPLPRPTRHSRAGWNPGTLVPVNLTCAGTPLIPVCVAMTPPYNADPSKTRSPWHPAPSVLKDDNEKRAPKALPDRRYDPLGGYIIRWMILSVCSWDNPNGRLARGPSLERTGSASTSETDSRWRNRPV